MQEYELTIVLVQKTSVAKKKAFLVKIEKLVEILKGKIVKSEDWGELQLATQINKEVGGNFLHFILELKRIDTKKLEDKLKLEDEIIRYLLVKKEK